MTRFVIKNLTPRHRARRVVSNSIIEPKETILTPLTTEAEVEVKEEIEDVKTPKKAQKNEINNEENINVMETKDKIELASAILDMDAQPKVKKIKKDKGLIERVEGSTIILTEDNRELLND